MSLSSSNPILYPFRFLLDSDAIQLIVIIILIFNLYYYGTNAKVFTAWEIANTTYKTANNIVETINRIIFVVFLIAVLIYLIGYTIFYK
jgi:hypothetical protein